jgi:hypothetical protein
MGIELYSETLSLNTARRCHRSKSQLLPSGAMSANIPLRRRSMAFVFYFFVAIVVGGPAFFMWTFWRDAKALGWNWTTEASRTMYVDVAKTLITASGIAVALVASSSAPLRAVDAIVKISARTGVISLVLCICTSLITILALTRGHERARSRNLDSGKGAEEGQLTDSELLFILIPSWVALSSFLVGALFLGRIAFHI